MFSHWLPSRLYQCNPGRHLWQEYEAPPAYPDHVARVVTRQCGRISISKTLKELHWLQVKWRIDFNVATTTYKLLDFNEPAYVRSRISVRVLRRSLRSSADDRRLDDHPTRSNKALGHFAALLRPSRMYCRWTFETHHQPRCSEQTESTLFSTSFQLMSLFYLSEYTMRLRFNFMIDISPCALYKYQ